MYPQPEIAKFISEHFVPVRIHAIENKQDFQRLGEKFDATWTPTTLLIDPPSTERHRIEGFLPKDDFAAQLLLGLAKAAFSRGKFEDAERMFEEVVKNYPKTDAAPEAQYWAGVSRYKGKNDAGALSETARRFQQRYSDSTWAKKASVWAA